jgi:hypothetical protein
MVGKPEGTIRGWVERGMAYPDIEPWGSFSRQYRQAERGLAMAVAKTSALRVQLMLEQMQAFMRWQAQGARGEAPALPTTADMLWLDRLREGRHPSDYGATKHRAPEPEHKGENYLDMHVMEREQLGALFADPPEPIRLALVDSAAQVYAVLLAGGFDPAAQKG